ncbi:electron transfer flavoprotein subunit beta/FixA family protein [Clostridiaceae bacterium 35-E11]
MNIIVLMKEVLNTKQVGFHKHTDTGTYTLIRNGVDSVMNYDDGNALEMALQWKEQNPDTYITVLCMGPTHAADMLRECLAIGADQVILVTDERLSGADTIATSTYLAHAINKIGTYDLVLAGYQSQDGRTGQVGPMVAEKLGVPQITYVKSFYQKEDKFVGIRELGAVDEKIAIELPCVFVISKQKYSLRSMTLSGIRKTLGKEICIWSLDDICSEGEQEVACLLRTATIEIKKLKKMRKKKIVKFEDYQNRTLTNHIREFQKTVFIDAHFEKKK